MKYTGPSHLTPVSLNHEERWISQSEIGVQGSFTAMPPTVEIKLSRPFYHAGDQVFGNVHVHLTEPTPNYGVEIQASCRVSGKENLLEDGNGTFVVYTHRMDPEGLHPVLQPGDHLWPFSFGLPTTAPPSFLADVSPPFKSIHLLKVLIRQEKSRDNILKEELILVRVHVPANILSDLPDPQADFVQKMERPFWFDGGLMRVKANFLGNILVPGETCEAQVELDMSKSKVMIRFMQTELLRRIVSYKGEDPRWDMVSLATSHSGPETSDLRPGPNPHSTILQLPIPKELELAPSLQTAVGLCEYYVRLFICPDSGTNIRKLFRIPLVPSTAVASARAASGAASPSLPITYSAPLSAKIVADISAPPAYNPL